MLSPFTVAALFLPPTFTGAPMVVRNPSLHVLSADELMELGTEHSSHNAVNFHGFKFTPPGSTQTLIVTYHCNAGSAQPEVASDLVHMVVGPISREVRLRKHYYTLAEVFVAGARRVHTNFGGSLSPELLHLVEKGLSALATTLRETFVRQRLGHGKTAAGVFGVCWRKGSLATALLGPSHTSHGCDSDGIDGRALSEHGEHVCLDFFTAVWEAKVLKTYLEGSGTSDSPCVSLCV